jgi:Rps23 Pro-64 3,4-dihydroxylase Tpa1-like proline 4-hydroxylase
LIKLLGDDYRNPILNLDIDFSVSKGGYRLRPHRDDVTRLYNFLIYLTDIPKKNGGSLILYKKKSKKNIRKSFRRFPKISELKIVKEFTPKQGTVIFFKSTPNSYHGVKRFKEFNCPKRFFIYGSYALNKPVIWSFKNNNYFPTIVPNNKRMLTSFHDSNYLLKKIS